MTCAADILAPFEFEYPGKIDSSAAGNILPEGTVSSGDKKAGSSKTLPAGFGEEAAKVYAVLSDEPLHTDEICVMTGLPPRNRRKVKIIFVHKRANTRFRRNICQSW